VICRPRFAFRGAGLSVVVLRTERQAASTASADAGADRDGRRGVRAKPRGPSLTTPLKGPMLRIFLLSREGFYAREGTR
jgi:hypothetical protein